ncbi:MAG: hypothetical protein JWL90_1225 [Chthoniobacteraceae bacterium]|nr:hypothetical protein [Chthoniobacteraceae bacterium]
MAFDTSRAPESYYFQFGVNPGYDFKPFPLKVEFPTFINVVGDHFYQRFDGSGEGSGVGVFSTQAKFTTPLSFVPKRYGAWTLYAGVQYYHLNNPCVLDGNQVLGATIERKENLWQLHGGISIFF